MTLRVLFENPSWCAVFKPANTLSVPSRQGEDDARDCVGLRLQSQLGKRIWPVHRLDFEVSGILIFALNADAHRDANAAFEKGLIQKTYNALSASESRDPDPRLHQDQARLVAPAHETAESMWSTLLVSGKRRSFAGSHGKESVTRASWQNHSRGTRLWTLHPLTGRSHQLRLHMALAGYPIHGDTLYGSEVPYTRDGIALQAVKLDFSKLSESVRRGLPLSLEIPLSL
jgi:tRNA pseudouridine32 synthase / 23S rRNA pseudouridine746 synthase